MNKKTAIRYAIGGCVAALAAAVMYAIVRLYVLGQRVDASIIIINVVLFAGIAGGLIYLSKKLQEIEEEELFRD